MHSTPSQHADQLLSATLPQISFLPSGLHTDDALTSLNAQRDSAIPAVDPKQWNCEVWRDQANEWRRANEIPYHVVHINSLYLDDAVELGRGGQGVVRRIRDYAANGTTVIFKEDLVLVDPAKYLEHLRIAYALVDCPYVVQYRAVVVKRLDDNDGALVPCGLLMEDLGDVTLHKWVTENATNLSARDTTLCTQLMHFLYDALRGLQTLHRAGAVHMDVKPANIVITPDGRAKLIDLGLAERAAFSRSNAGTKGFRAPEIERGQTPLPTSASDVWSLGVTLRWCLHRVFPPKAAPNPTQGDETQGDDAVSHTRLQTAIFWLTDENPSARLTTTEILLILWKEERLSAAELRRQGVRLLRSANEYLGRESLTFVAETVSLKEIYPNLVTAGRELLGKGSQAWHCARDIVDFLHEASLAIDFIAAGAKVTQEDVALLRIDVFLDSGIESNLKKAAADIDERIMKEQGDRTLLTIRRLRVARLLRRLNVLDIQMEINNLEVSALSNNRMSLVQSKNRMALVIECAHSLGELGNRRALAMYDEALQIMRSTLGADHPSAASTICDQANALQERFAGMVCDQERLLRAITMYDKALQIMQSLADTHVVVSSHYHAVCTFASTLCNQANVLQSLGDHRAIPVSVVVLETTLADTCLIRAFTLANKASAMQKLGNRQSWVQAKALYDEALHNLRSRLDDAHPLVGTTLRNRKLAMKKLDNREMPQNVRSRLDDAYPLVGPIHSDRKSEIAMQKLDDRESSTELHDRESPFPAITMDELPIESTQTDNSMAHMH